MIGSKKKEWKVLLHYLEKKELR